VFCFGIDFVVLGSVACGVAGVNAYNNVALSSP